MKRKFFALIMAAVLCLGMSMTAFAADETVDPNGSPEPTFAQIVYDNVTIAAGGGYLEKITDPAMQDLIMERVDGEYDRLAEYTYTSSYTSLFDGQVHTYTTRLFYPDFYFAFDVQGVESGQVTVHLGDEGKYFSASNAAGTLVAVSHYNTVTEEWETMDDFAVIDENGNVTFEFESYSPVLLTVLRESVEWVESTNHTPEITYLETTYAPAQTLTPVSPAGTGGQGGTGSGDNGTGAGTQNGGMTNGTATQNGGTTNGTATGTGTAQTQATAPKTGDSNLGLIVLLAGAAAVCGAVLTRKKEA